jgi:hypothetical protein
MTAWCRDDWTRGLLMSYESTNGPARVRRTARNRLAKAAQLLPKVNSDTLVLGLMVFAVFAVGIGVVMLARTYLVLRTRKPECEDDLLTDLQRAYIKGELDDAEYQRIQESLQRRSPDAPLPDKPALPEPPEEDELA